MVDLSQACSCLTNSHICNYCSGWHIRILSMEIMAALIKNPPTDFERLKQIRLNENNEVIYEYD